MSLSIFLAEYAAFLAKCATAGFVLVGLFAIGGLSGRSKKRGGRMVVTDMTQEYRKQRQPLLDLLLDKPALKERAKAGRAQPANAKTVFHIEFDGDLRATQVASLRAEISAILDVRGPNDEVVLTLTSPGGTVDGYGLAAMQLVRLREAGMALTVCVDRCAASGGYLMAVVGSRIVAAPFAYVGSIGVVTEFPNFHGFLRQRGIEYVQVTAGDKKRTISPLAKLTDEGRSYTEERLSAIHRQFQDHVTAYRSGLDISAVATGDVWLAKDALRLGLVDELGTSDDCLAAMALDCRVVHLAFVIRRPLSERVFHLAALAVGDIWSRLSDRSRLERLQ